jgi:hypothetical protein
VVLLAVGCRADTGDLEARVADLERRSDRRAAEVQRLEERAKDVESALAAIAKPTGLAWWCPLDAHPNDSGICIAEDEATAADAMRLCNGYAKHAGSTCIHTRLVVCAVTPTQARAEACFARWSTCEAKAGPERRCALYFDGQPVPER